MVGPSKILTVSYGTFSCTLEGFDDSFETMKAIAEYFRDLAADDRYFGAEPPQLDTDMLAQIAAKQIEGRVEAHRDDSGVTLRAAREEEPKRAPAPETAPVRPDRQTAVLTEPNLPRTQQMPSARAADSDSIAAKLQRIRAIVHRSESPDVWAEDSDLLGQPSHVPMASDSAQTAPLPQPDVVATARAATSPSGADVEADDSPAVDTPSIAQEAPAAEETPAEIAPDAPVAASAAPADAEEQAPIAPDVAPEADAPASAPEGAAEVAPEEAEAPTEIEEADASQTLVTYAAEESEAPAATPEEPEEDAAIAISSLSTPDVDTTEDTPAEADDRSDNAMADDQADDDIVARIAGALGTQDESAGEEDEEDPVEDDHTAPQPRIRASVIRMRNPEATILTAPNLAELDGVDDFDPDADRSDEIEFDFEDDSDDEADDAPTAAPEAPASPPQGDADLSRLLSQTDAEMDAPELSRRRQAMAHLKAAVAATEAARQMGEAEESDDDDASIFRDDLDQAVRPRRPVTGKTREARPSPLRLVPSQRIDASEPAPTRVIPRRVGGAATAMAAQTAPQPVSAPEEQPEQELDLTAELNIDTLDPVAPPQESATVADDLSVEDSFRGYCSQIGAETDPEIAQAAATFLAREHGEPVMRTALVHLMLNGGVGGVTRQRALNAVAALIQRGALIRIGNGAFELAKSKDSA
ncbi:MAG: hypothetical protein CSA72_04775 [Rhodobacterales bacterium]|nr:MAG: hypothetical protein CSA72_04775 [Rhodobacterales bacterium]